MGGHSWLQLLFMTVTWLVLKIPLDFVLHKRQPDNTVHVKVYYFVHSRYHGGVVITDELLRVMAYIIIMVKLQVTN